MKDQYINRTLQPPEPPEDADQKFEELIKWIREDFKAEQIFDLEIHDKELFNKIMHWLEVEHQFIIHTPKREEVWEQFCKQPLNK